MPATTEIYNSSQNVNSILGVPVAFAGLANGQVIQYNGTDFVNAALVAATGVTSVAGTIIVTGAVPNINVEINLAHTMVWTVIQEFDAGIILDGAARFDSGIGAPVTAGRSVGDYYFRTGTPTVAGQRIYVCTVVGAPDTWVGIL